MSLTKQTKKMKKTWIFSSKSKIIWRWSTLAIKAGDSHRMPYAPLRWSSDDDLFWYDENEWASHNFSSDFEDRLSEIKHTQLPVRIWILFPSEINYQSTKFHGHLVRLSSMPCDWVFQCCFACIPNRTTQISFECESSSIFSSRK